MRRFAMDKCDLVYYKFDKNKIISECEFSKILFRRLLIRSRGHNIINQFINIFKLWLIKIKIIENKLNCFKINNKRKFIKTII